MAAVEAKLELLRQLRMEHDSNRREMQSREMILYGKTFTEPQRDGATRGDHHLWNTGGGFVLRCLMTVLLCTGIYYAINQPESAEGAVPILFTQEQTQQIKMAMEDWLTKNDLSFGVK